MDHGSVGNAGQLLEERPQRQQAPVARIARPVVQGGGDGDAGADGRVGVGDAVAEEDQAPHAMPDPLDPIAPALPAHRLEDRRHVAEDVVVEVPALLRHIAQTAAAQVGEVDVVAVGGQPGGEGFARQVEPQMVGREAVAEDHRGPLAARGRHPVDGEADAVGGQRVEPLRGRQLVAVEAHPGAGERAHAPPVTRRVSNVSRLPPAGGGALPRFDAETTEGACPSGSLPPRVKPPGRAIRFASPSRGDRGASPPGFR